MASNAGKRLPPSSQALDCGAPLCPEHNRGRELVPAIATNRSVARLRRLTIVRCLLRYHSPSSRLHHDSGDPS